MKDIKSTAAGLEAGASATRAQAVAAWTVAGQAVGHDVLAGALADSLGSAWASSLSTATGGAWAAARRAASIGPDVNNWEATGSARLDVALAIAVEYAIKVAFAKATSQAMANSLRPGFEAVITAISTSLEAAVLTAQSATLATEGEWDAELMDAWTKARLAVEALPPPSNCKASETEALNIALRATLDAVWKWAAHDLDAIADAAEAAMIPEVMSVQGSAQALVRRLLG